MSSSLSVCHVVASLNPQTGGPAVSVSRLAAALASQGVTTSICTLDYPELGQLETAGQARVVAVSPNPFTRGLRGWSPDLARAIQREAHTEDIIHNHGLWMWPNLYARRSAVRANVPLVISPRGMVESWSLAQGRAKKRIVWRLFEQSNFRNAALFHATSTAEAESIRGLGFRQPIAIIPNGVDLLSLSPGSANGSSTLASTAELAGKKWILFLSRIDPKKGIDLLLTAWRGLAAQFPDHVVVIAGSDLKGQRAEFENQARTLNIAHRVVFTGMLEGEAKAEALRRCEFSVLPTRSENFGIVIAEALAAGKPVITTKAAPWKSLESHRCGWWIDVNAEALERSLAEALSCSSETLRAMGARGQKMVGEEFSWASIADRMTQVYRHITQQGERPACLVN